VLTGLALLTKALAFPLPLLVAVAILGAPGALLVQKGKALGVAAAVTLVAGGWWWPANLVRFHQLTPTLDVERFRTLPPDTHLSLGNFLYSFFRLFGLTFWGAYEGVDTLLGNRFAAVASVILGIVLVVGLIFGATALAVPRPRLMAGFLLLPSVTQLLSLGVSSHDRYLTSGLTPVQGRYVFGGVTALAVVAALGLWWLCARRPWATVAVAAAAGIYLQYRSFSTVLSYTWGPAGGNLAAQLHALRTWVPIGGWLVDVSIGAIVAALVLTAVALIAGLRRSRPRSPSPASGEEPESTPSPPSDELVAPARLP
jgi:small subunit ribosomal protein S36